MLCQVCHTDQRPTRNGAFSVHGAPRCWGSGLTRGQVDDRLRTFESVDNTEQVRRVLQLIDNGDSLAVQAVLAVRGAGLSSAVDPSASVEVRIDPAEVFRLIDELVRVVRERGWSRNTKPS